MNILQRIHTPLIGIRRRPSTDFSCSSLLDLQISQEARRRGEEDAMALLYLYDREAWAYLMGIPADKTSIITTQESAICQ